MDLIHAGGKIHPFPRDAYHPGGHSYGSGLRRNFAQHHGICRDTGAIPHLEGPQYFGARRYHYIIPQGGVPLSLVFAGAPQGDSVVEQAVIPHFRSLANDNPHAVVDDKPLSDFGSGVNLNTGDMPGDL